jgi:hypothetical protein
MGNTINTVCWCDDKDDQVKKADMGSISKRSSRRGIKKDVKATCHFNTGQDNPRIIITTNAAVIYNHKEAKETVLETIGKQTTPVVTRVVNPKVEEKSYKVIQEPEVHLHISDEKSPHSSDQQRQMKQPSIKIDSPSQEVKLVKGKFWKLKIIFWFLNNKTTF